jgi:predicted phosphodiesterase
MRYCIFSDVHSNFDALTAVLEYLKSNPVDRIICLGDIVGYGPEPHRCIEALRKLTNFRCICGDHDAAICGKNANAGLNESAVAALEINKKYFTADDEQYLDGFSGFIAENDIRFVHGSPRDSMNEYLFMMEKFKENISYFNETICFVGHTHHPLIYMHERGADNGICINLNDDVEIFNLPPDKKYIINVGSVGQPRDYKPSACIAFFDTKSSTLTVRRIPYNFRSTQDKMIKLGMPGQLIERLATGT